MQKEQTDKKQSHATWLFVLLLLIVLAYSNTFNASWHLDDVSNIVHNPNVHVSSLAPEDWLKTIRYPFSGPDGKA